MLASDKIAKAFLAIVDEAEKLQAQDLPEEAAARIKTIISIAKHQSDIRDAAKGGCKAHQECK